MTSEVTLPEADAIRFTRMDNAFRDKVSTIAFGPATGKLLAIAYVGADPRRPCALNDAIDMQLSGHLCVKSAVDMAGWNILGQVAVLPRWQLIGGDHAAPVAVNSSIPTGTPEEMIALIRRARRRAMVCIPPNWAGISSPPILPALGRFQALCRWTRR